MTKLWQKKEYSEDFKKKIEGELEVKSYICEILASRFDDVSEVKNFLSAKLKDNMKDPFILGDMQKGIDLIKGAISGKKKIAVFGDYDVDGGTSSALLKKYFRILGVELEIYIPDRIKEGYGPNELAFEKLKSLGIDLIITVDCGASSHEVMVKAKEMGLEIMVIDHHIALGKKPVADVVINPNHEGESGEYTYLSAVGVCFLFVVALQGNLKKEGFFNGKEEPNLMGFLDIVALGTVCDVVPLLGLNRAFVKQGLKIMKEKPSIGIKALANVANLDLEQVSCYSLGFVLGPRINAGGRVGEASLGAEILSSESETRAMEIALKLEQYNAERKAIEATILEETYEKIEAERLYENSVIIVSGDNWHVGVIGILASRVKEKYNRPTAVISFDENGVGKASARSINGVDFGGMVIRAKDQELLVNGGGHKMAAGFTIVKSNLAEFSDFLNDNLKDQVGDALKNQVISYDKEFSVSALNVDLCKDLEILAPFGVANSEPRFVLKNCKIVHFNIMKEKHLKLVLAEESSGLYGKNIEAVIWQAADKGFIEEVAKNPKAKFSFLGKIRINNWNNQEKVQFEVEDLRVC